MYGKTSVQLSVLPSYTRLGMAALLPHKTLEMTDDFQVLVDDILCDNLAGRQQVLQSYNRIVSVYSSMISKI